MGIGEGDVVKTAVFFCLNSQGKDNIVWGELLEAPEV